MVKLHALLPILAQHKNRFALVVVVGLVALFFSAYFTQSMKQYNAHKTRGDLGNFAQAMWNTTQGRIMQNTFNYSLHNFWGDRSAEIPENSNIFGIHFNPILFLFVPLYFLVPIPQTLLFIQAFLTALGGLLVYITARKYINNLTIPLALTVSYFVYIPVVYSVLYEYHTSTLGIFFGLVLIYCLDKKALFYWTSVVLFLAVQENAALPVMVLGLFLGIQKVWRKRGIATVIIGTVYLLGITKFVIPALSNYKNFIFESAYGNNLGGNFSEIISHSIRNPALLIQALVNKENFIYLARLALLFLPFVLLSPAYLVALAGVAPSIISSSTALKSSTLHYDAMGVAFTYLAAILGIKFVLSRFPYRLTAYVIALTILLLSTISYKQFVAPRFNRHVLALSISTPTDQKLDSLIAMIPANASVSTQDYIMGHLTQRRFLYLFPIYRDRVDYLLLATGQPTWPLSKEEHLDLVNELVLNKNYNVLYKDEDFILIKKVIY